MLTLHKTGDSFALSPVFIYTSMIFLIKVFTYVNCVDCLRHLKTLRDYCDRTPTILEIIDIDKEENIPLIFEYNIIGIPHTLCYNIRGEIMHSFPGVKTAEEFDDIVYHRICNQ